MASESSVKKAIKLVLRYALGASFALQALLLMDLYIASFVLADMPRLPFWASILAGALPFTWLLKPVFATRTSLMFFLVGLTFISIAAITAEILIIMIFPAALGFLGVSIYSLLGFVGSAIDKIDPVSGVRTPVLRSRKAPESSRAEAGPTVNSRATWDAANLGPLSLDPLEPPTVMGAAPKHDDPISLALYLSLNDPHT